LQWGGTRGPGACEVVAESERAESRFGAASCREHDRGLAGPPVCAARHFTSVAAVRSSHRLVACSTNRIEVLSIRSHQIRRANYAGDVCRRTGIFRVRSQRGCHTVRLLGRSPAEPRNLSHALRRLTVSLICTELEGNFGQWRGPQAPHAAAPLQLTPSGRYRVTDLLEGFAPFQKPALTGTANVLATGTAIVPAART
jgi:hypothetical protein